MGELVRYWVGGWVGARRGAVQLGLGLCDVAAAAPDVVQRRRTAGLLAKLNTAPSSLTAAGVWRCKCRCRLCMCAACCHGMQQAHT